MKNHEVIYQLRELNDTWRKNDFVLTKEQRTQYHQLVTLRRQRVQELYKEGRVSKGRSKSEE